MDDVFVVTVNPPAALLGRYWLNEAPSGQAPTTVLDDQASPLNLSVTYDANLAWTLDNGHRGARVLGRAYGHRFGKRHWATKYTTNLGRSDRGHLCHRDGVGRRERRPYGRFPGKRWYSRFPIDDQERRRYRVAISCPSGVHEDVLAGHVGRWWCGVCSTSCTIPTIPP